MVKTVITPQEELSPLEKAAEYLYDDYLNDKELTVFNHLDCEDFMKRGIVPKY